MNSSLCNATLDMANLNHALFIMSSTGGASVALSLVAVILVVGLKLYKIFVYRLALYQVLTAMVFGVVCSIEVAFINFDRDVAFYSRLCEVVASVFFCLEWVKLMFTSCVTVHLFCFAVCYKNLKKLEGAYIACSLILPLVIAAVPYATRSYGRAGAWCWIQDWNNNCPTDISIPGNIETFALWYGPAFVLLLVDSIAMTLMGVVLACRGRGRKRNPLLDLSYKAIIRERHWGALRQMLPLLAYPIIFFTFILAMLAYRVYNAVPHSAAGYELLEATAMLSPGVGLTASMVLILHILIARCSKRCARAPLQVTIRQDTAESRTTYQETTTPSSTYWSCQGENDIVANQYSHDLPHI